MVARAQNRARTKSRAQNRARTQNIQEYPRISKNIQKYPRISKNIQKYPRISRNAEAFWLTIQHSGSSFNILAYVSTFWLTIQHSGSHFKTRTMTITPCNKQERWRLHCALNKNVDDYTVHETGTMASTLCIKQEGECRSLSPNTSVDAPHELSVS